MEKALYLTGFMGSGKTTTGKVLAESLDRPFVDLDECIERAVGMKVREVFETEGEEAFRVMETEALERTAAIEAPIVATGGGTVTNERNRSWMRRHGVSVWLNLPFSALAARVESSDISDRPLFGDRERAFELYQERLPAYREADWTLDVGVDEVATSVAERIILLMGDRVCNS